MKNIRTELKIFRIKNQLTQAEIAEKIGIKRTLYSNVERGNGGNTLFWEKFQRAFNIPDEEMFKFIKTDNKADL